MQSREYHSSPNGIRTRVAGLRTRSPRPLDDGTVIYEIVKHSLRMSTISAMHSSSLFLRGISKESKGRIQKSSNPGDAIASHLLFCQFYQFARFNGRFRLAVFCPSPLESALGDCLRPGCGFLTEGMSGAVTRIVPFLLCLWPGLARLWLQGSGSALALSLFSAAALNTALIATFIWPEIGGGELPSWFLSGAAWLLVLCLWVSGAWETRQMLLTWSTPPLDRESDQLFRQAQAEYLRANWVVAERLLTELMRHRPADAEGKLLLATVLRRAKRVEDARQCLLELKELPAGQRWHRELALEMKLLAETVEEESSEQKLRVVSEEIQTLESVAATTSEGSRTGTATTDLVGPHQMPSDTRPRKDPAATPANTSSKHRHETDRTNDEIDVIAFDRVERERRRRAA